ncbi:hypothetical protein B0H65DRAFT_178934 [Neurospora tetraspora]|uniref:Uncharacterized protein n=1 Tax=Neurospora tetraspora TaxID=94610 RepID=A0AAE0MUT7_9PEZI|nr:hypothetical protein B0H65DRAFT_178934 [Neurospora tetraspora]
MAGHSSKQSWAFQGRCRYCRLHPSTPTVVAHSLHYMDYENGSTNSKVHKAKRGWLKTSIAERHEVKTLDSRGVAFSGSSSPIRSEDLLLPVPSLWTPQPL